jgi:hypothetical protein
MQRFGKLSKIQYFIRNPNLQVRIEHTAAELLDPYNLYGYCYTSGNSYMGTIIGHRMKEMGLVREDSDRATYPPLCAQDFEQNIANYLNQATVRTQLHIPRFLPPWKACK